MKYNSGFRPVKTYPTNVRVRLKKEELNTDEALKVEKITTRGDYSSLYGKFKAKLGAMSNEEVEELIGHNRLLNQYLKSIE